MDDTWKRSFLQKKLSAETIIRKCKPYCKKNQAYMMLPANVEVKKIPKDLLDKCNFESEVQE